MFCFVFFFVCFFVQAEDGIRDLVRSRGLGDVYKRQVEFFPLGFQALDLRFRQLAHVGISIVEQELVFGKLAFNHGVAPVSYTHLTLPTSDLV